VVVEERIVEFQGQTAICY